MGVYCSLTLLLWVYVYEPWNSIICSFIICESMWYFRGNVWQWNFNCPNELYSPTITCRLFLDTPLEMKLLKHRSMCLSFHYGHINTIADLLLRFLPDWTTVLSIDSRFPPFLLSSIYGCVCGKRLLCCVLTNNHTMLYNCRNKNEQLADAVRKVTFDYTCV